MQNLQIRFASALFFFLIGIFPSWSRDLIQEHDASNSVSYSIYINEWTRLAEQGNADAQFKLGVIFKDAEYRDDKASFKWFKLAAEQGHIEAMSSLGSIYLHAGASTEGLEWLTLAAEQGHLISQSNLGYLYRSGAYGVTKNWKESVRWSLLAAKQGDANNQKQVGISYYHGIGVIQDYAEAMKWLRLSAEQGHVESQWVLADMYKTGKGSTSNKTLAHMWFNIAASNGYSPAKEERDRLSETMTSSEVHTAQKLARECVKKGYKDC